MRRCRILETKLQRGFYAPFPQTVNRALLRRGYTPTNPTRDTKSASKRLKGLKNRPRLSILAIGCIHTPERESEVVLFERPPARAAMADKPDASTVLKPSETQVKPPPMFQVGMDNDHYPQMGLVVDVLQVF